MGESNGWLYLNSGREVNLKGESSLIVPGSHGSSKSAPYALEVIHEYEDDNGNLVKETMDASSWASWSIESPNSEIGFDSESREILIGENLADGEYEAAVLANLWGTVYERKVKVIVGGESARIISAACAAGGIKAELYLPESFGGVTLFAAAYNSSGMLLNSAQKKTSANSSDNGKILVPINLEGAAYAKAMLFKDMNSVQPVAESRRITLN